MYLKDLGIMIVKTPKVSLPEKLFVSLHPMGVVKIVLH